jgi:ABC-type nickel/cobalt efflux system permease component RcnA
MAACGRLRSLGRMLAALSGLVAGLLHVLAGPDHLAAVAPLAVRGHRRAWFAGVRWGIGHSAGVVLIGVLAIMFRSAIPVAGVSSLSERLVGVLLIAMGFWTVRQALRVEVHEHEHSHDGSRHGHVHFHGPGHSHPMADGPAAVDAHGHGHGHAALGIGILHGLAGSSHFLGVLPSLGFTRLADSIAYLAAFGVGTVLAMAGFSALLGRLAERWAGRARRGYRGLLWACSAVAFGVGGWWLLAGGA